MYALDQYPPGASQRICAAVTGNSVHRLGTMQARAASKPDPATFVTLSPLYGPGRALGGSGPPASDPEQIERIAPRPLLLLSAGRSTEARANEEYKRRGGTTTELWNLPEASHAAALRTDPRGYERRVIGFLDRALRQL